MRGLQRNVLHGWPCWPILIGCLWAADARGQTVYRCGDSYSQSSCPGAVIVSVDDARSPAQKSQTDAATRQAQQMATRLEQQRVALESAARPGGPARLDRKAVPPPRPAAGTGARKKSPRGPEFFTAAAAKAPAAATTSDKPAEPGTR